MMDKTEYEDIQPNFVVEFEDQEEREFWPSITDSGDRAEFHNFQSAVAYRNERQKKSDDNGYGLMYRVHSTQSGHTWTAVYGGKS